MRQNYKNARKMSTTNSTSFSLSYSNSGHFASSASVIVFIYPSQGRNSQVLLRWKGIYL